MKFKHDIEAQAGFKDKDGQLGTAGQILSSTGTQTDWIDQSTLVSGSAERVSILVKNGEGTALVKGDPVYIIGSVGASARLEVGLCDASDSSKMPCVGLLEQDLLNNGEGTAVTAGKLRNLITTPIDGQTTTENDTIYVKAGGSSGSALTTTKPTGSTNLIQNVGQVGRVSTSSDGNFVVSAIMRTNDVPNLPTGKIWVGDGNTTVSTVVHLDETNGRMGIGTTSPQYTLHLNGGASRTDVQVTTDGFGVTNTDGAQFGIQSIGAYIWNFENTDLYFGTNNSRVMTIKPSGNVGIGTTSPVSALDISKDTASLLNLHRPNSSAAAASFLDFSFNTSNGTEAVYSRIRSDVDTNTDSAQSGDLSFYNASSGSIVERMRITSAGNVGIGTTSPSARLDVTSATHAAHFTSTGDQVPVRIISDYISNVSTIGFQGANSTNSYNVRAGANSDDFVIYTANTERLRINSSGNVGIGTTNPTSKTHIYYGGGAPNGLHVQSSANRGKILVSDNDTAAYMIAENSLASFGRQDALSANNLNITLGGNVGIGTTSPGAKLEISHSGANNGLLLENTLNSSNYQIALNIRENEGLIFQRWIAGAFNGNLMRIGYTGAIKFDAYDSTNNTGTPTYLLGTDASGNVVKTNTVPGSAAGPYLPLAGGTMTGTAGVLMPDDFKLKFGNSGDLTIEHTGTFSRIQDNGTGDLVIQGQNILFTDSTGTDIYATLTHNAGVELRYDNSKKFETTSAGVKVTGDLLIYLDNAGYFEVDKSDNSVKFADNTKAKFGTGMDLQIYHDGSNSFIDDSGAGDLYVRASDNMYFQTYGSGKKWITLNENAGVQLFHNDSKKFETTSTGVSVTGTAAATTFSGDLNGTINTATTAVTKANATNDTTVATTAFVQNLIGTIPAGLVFQGTWNASTNTPTLTSGSGTTGHFYIVSTDGSTNLDGITDWKVGDWAVFVEQGATDAWEKVDNSSVLDGSGTGQKVTKWNGSGTSNTLTDGPITFSSNDSTFSGNITTTSTATGAITLDGGTGVSTSGAFILRQNGDGANNGMAITSSHATSHRIWKDASGNLNIGSSGNTNAFKQDITGNVTIEGDVTLSAVGSTGEIIRTTDNTEPYFALQRNSGSNGVGVLRLMDGGDLTFDTGATGAGQTTRLTIDGATGNATFTGKVGINCTPSYKLQWSDGTRTGLLDTNIGTVVIGSVSNDDLALYTNLTERMRITSGGNVGIGTTSPGAKLQIGSATYAPNANLGNNLLQIKSSSGFAYLTIGNGDVANSTSYIGGASGFTVIGSVTDAGALSEHVRVTNTGNVLVNKTSSTGDMFQVQGNNNVYASRLDGSATVGQSYGLRVRAGTSSADKSMLVENTSGTDLFLVRGDGNVGIGTTSPNQSNLVVSPSAQSADVDGITVVYNPDGATNRVRSQLKIDDFSGVLELTNSADTIATYITAGGDSYFTAGNVGIGTTSPGSKLTVDTNTNSSSAPLLIQNTSLSNSGQLQIGIPAANDAYASGAALGDVVIRNTKGTSKLILGGTDSVVIGAGGTDFDPRMTIKSSGNVGIGTTDPKSKLQVAGGIQMADDTDAASADKVGTMRYRTGTEYVEVTGTELVTNGNFATDSDWTKGTGWTISGGKASSAGNSGAFFYQNLTGITTGDVLKVVYEITDYTSGQVRIGTGSGLSQPYGTYRSAVGVYVEYITKTSTNVSTGFISDSFVGSIDNVSVIEVTAEDASYADMCMQTGSSTYEWVNIVRNTY